MISVIIPLYNASRFIAETLASVQSQTYSDWECIVVDDGSTDNSAAIVKNIAVSDERIKYVYQENAGPSAARNHGLQLAKGEYVQFLDADDWFPPNRFQHMLDAYLNVEEGVVLFSEYAIGTEQCIQRRIAKKRICLKHDLDASYLFANFFSSITFIPGCVLFRRGNLESIWWDETMKFSEDWKFYLDIALTHKVVFRNVKEELFTYRNSSNSLSTHLDEVYKSNLFILAHYRNVFPRGFYKQYAFMQWRNQYSYQKKIVDKIYFTPLPKSRERLEVAFWNFYFHVEGYCNKILNII